MVNYKLKKQFQNLAPTVEIAAKGLSMTEMANICKLIEQLEMPTSANELKELLNTIKQVTH